MEASWVLPLLAGLITVLGLYLSRPERPVIAFVTAVIAVLAGCWQTYEEYGQAEAESVLARRVIDRLARQERQFFAVLSGMVVRASDGWLPSGREEFFSRRTAELICSELNVDRKAPVEPTVSYDQWLANESQVFLEAIRSGVVDGGSQLDAELMAALVGVEGSELLQIGQGRLHTRRFDETHSVTRAPLLCWGLEPLVADSLLKLKALDAALGVQEKRHGIHLVDDWLDFPAHYKERFLGQARFSKEELDAWRKAHPSAPGPAMFGRGDPNKAQIPDPRSQM